MLSLSLYATSHMQGTIRDDPQLIIRSPSLSPNCEMSPYSTRPIRVPDFAPGKGGVPEPDFGPGKVGTKSGTVSHPALT